MSRLCLVEDCCGLSYDRTTLLGGVDRPRVIFSKPTAWRSVGRASAAHS